MLAHSELSGNGGDRSPSIAEAPKCVVTGRVANPFALYWGEVSSFRMSVFWAREAVTNGLKWASLIHTYLDGTNN